MIATMTPPRTPPAALAELLGSAQVDAERFHGRGPAQAWRPAFAWKGWAAAAIGLVTAAAALALFWQWGSAPVQPAALPTPAAPSVSTAAAPEPRPVAVSPELAPVPAAPRPAATPAASPCVGADCAALSGPARLAVPAPGEPVDLDAWALDPQATSVGTPWQHPAAGNLPAVPDEHDPTPAEEAVPEALSDEPPVE